MSFSVFHRRWWDDAHPSEGYPDDLKPCSTAAKTLIAARLTEDQAFSKAKEWNRAHEPGRYSRKAEVAEIVMKCGSCRELNLPMKETQHWEEDGKFFQRYECTLCNRTYLCDSKDGLMSKYNLDREE